MKFWDYVFSAIVIGLILIGLTIGGKPDLPPGAKVIKRYGSGWYKFKLDDACYLYQASALTRVDCE